MSSISNEEILRVAQKELRIDISNDLLRDQLIRGYAVELEHGTKLGEDRSNVTGDDPTMTLMIVWAHLLEIPDYYDRLEKMEKDADKEWDEIGKDKSSAKAKLLLHIGKHRTKKEQIVFADAL